MSGADEPTIDQRLVCERAGAGLCPCLLLGASTCRIDLEVDASAGCEIESEMCGSTEVEPYGTVESCGTVELRGSVEPYR